MSLYKNDTIWTTASGITFGNCREERPRFRRSYRAQVNNRVSIECEAQTFLGSRSWSGELRQNGGKVVWFEPTRVADQILDPVLVPLIEARCEEMFSLDREYMRSGLRQFVDESGTTWSRS